MHKSICNVSQGSQQDIHTFKTTENGLPDEGGRMLELPSHYITPLIDSERKIPMTTNPLGKNRVHYSFAGWANSNRLIQRRVSRSCDPGHLHCTVE